MRYSRFLLIVLLVIFDEFRDDLLHGAGDDVVGNLVDRSVGIAVDGYDDARVLHTCDVLNLTADTTSDVHLRMHGYASLTNLPVAVYPSCVHCGAACAYFTVKLLGKLEELVEAFL